MRFYSARNVIRGALSVTYLGHALGHIKYTVRFNQDRSYWLSPMRVRRGGRRGGNGDEL